MCGGSYAITGYAREDGEEGGIEVIVVDTRSPTPSPVALPGISYVGCFADAEGDGRLMPTLAAADPSGMTTEVRRGGGGED